MFDSLEASGATTLTELNSNIWESYNAVLRAAAKIDPDVQGEIFTSLKKLAAAGKDVLWDEAKKAFDKFDPAKALLQPGDE